jgi:hypothetical protein
MTTSDQTLLTRTMAIAKLDRRPLTGLPGTPRVALAGLVAVVGSLVADVILVALGKAVFSTPSSFDPFHFGSYAPLTVLGVLAATIGWGILVRLSSQPIWVLTRAAIIVTLVLLVPDVLILPGNPKTGVLTLMVMHVAIAIVSYSALRWISPVTGYVQRPSAARQSATA